MNPALRPSTAIPIHNEESVLPERDETAVGLSRLAWGLMICCWIVQAVADLQFVNPDGISYIEIAQSVNRGKWSELINGYWSPAYPALIAGWLAALKPSTYHEILAVNLLGVVLLVFVLWSFEYFMTGIAALQRNSPDENLETLPVEKWPIRGLLYLVFFCITLWFTPSDQAQPDILVFAFFLLASGMVVRIYCGEHGLRRFFFLGVLLACSYLSKAVMFPIAFVFLTVAAFAVKEWNRILLRGSIGILAFLLVAGPFIGALSVKKGRLTHGDVGGIAYAEFVNGITKGIHWQGGPAGSGMPAHPTRKLAETPPVYEFKAPIGGSYPPWSDPSYWYEGVRPRFHLWQQLRILKASADRYFEIYFVQLICMTACFVLFLCWSGLPRLFLSEFWRLKFLWVPALFGLALYALVTVLERYIAGFVLVLWIAGLAALRFRKAEVNRRVNQAISLSVEILLVVQIAWQFSHTARKAVSRLDFPALEMANYLDAEGVRPGGKVAEVGDALFDHIWAHLARVTIVAEVPQEGVLDFWSASPETRWHVLDLFAQAGAVIVVAKVVPSGKEREGWKKVGDTPYYALDLRK
jgi:hypothetical protein